VKWTLYAILYLIGVLTLGLLLMGAEQMPAAALDLVFLVIAVVMFRFALKDVSAALDIASDERERAELRTLQVLLILTFVISAGVLGYSFLKALFPFVP
jgi:Sec-independent protein translocase protein TatA